MEFSTPKKNKNCFLSNFEWLFTPRTWLRSAWNFGKTCFRRFPTFHFSTLKNFCWWFFFKKNRRHFFLTNCHFLKIWNSKSGYRQIRRRNSLPVVRLFFLYEPWRRGKQYGLCFWGGFWAEHDFNLLPFFCDFFFASIFFWRIAIFWRIGIIKVGIGRSVVENHCL